MPRLLLFDIDMTLIRTSRAGRDSIDRAFAAEFGVESATAGVGIDGRTDRAIFLEVIAHHQLANGDLEAVFRRATEAYLRVLPETLSGREGLVLPGVVDLLDRLADTHPALGLATGNMRRGARAKLSHFGLWDRFATGGFGDVTPVRSEMVREAIEALAAVLRVDAHPRDTIVIGDTPLDVEAAHLAGARALAVATGSFSMEQLASSGAEWVVPDLTNPEALSILVGA